MGVILPPNSNKNNASDSSESTIINITFYFKPSIGLKIWGPLVPSSDCLPCLYGLTALQTIIGLSMFRHARLTWNQTSLWSRISKAINISAGSYLVFNSGLELSRLILPYDPWYDEAKVARAKAYRETGVKPNYWFGPVNYKPMSLIEWSDKVDNWIEKTEEIEEEEENLSFTIQNAQFHSVYQQIKTMNQIRNSEILKQLQDFKGFKELHLPNYQTFHNEEFDRPDIVIPEGVELEDDANFKDLWEVNNPWYGLKIDTIYEIRFIPKFRKIDKLEEVNSTKKMEDKENLDRVGVVGKGDL